MIIAIAQEFGSSVKTNLIFKKIRLRKKFKPIKNLRVINGGKKTRHRADLTEENDII